MVMSSLRRKPRSVLTKFAGSRCTPTQTPFTKIFVDLGMTLGEISSRFSIVHSSRNSRRGAEGEPTETRAMSDKFFTRPTACPSGVSAGHTIPQCELCSCRGLASFPSRPMGELSRRRCDSVDENDSRFSTCETPARMSCAPCAPQLPVANEYFNPEVMVFALTASVSWMSLPESTHRWQYRRTSLVSFRNSCRNSIPMSGPARSMRLFPKWSRSSSLRRFSWHSSSLCVMYPRKYALRVSQFWSTPTCGSSSFCRISCAYLMRFSRVTPTALPLLPMKSSATAWLWITIASSMDGRNRPIISSSPKSYTMCSKMSLSATNPSARNTTNSGISVRMYGSVTRITPGSPFVPGA